MGKIFAGLIFLFFDFPLAGINVMPNFVGYILTYLGMNEMRFASLTYAQTQKLAAGAAVYDGILWIISLPWAGFSGAAAVLLSIASGVLQLAIAFYIWMGVRELEQTPGAPDMGSKNMRICWWGLLICWVVSLLPIALSQLAVILTIAAALGYLLFYYHAWQLYRAS